MQARDSILQNGKQAPGPTCSPAGSCSAPSHQLQKTKSTFLWDATARFQASSQLSFAYLPRTCCTVGLQL